MKYDPKINPKSVKIEVNTAKLYYALVHLQDKCRELNPFLSCVLYEDEGKRALDSLKKDRSDMAVIDFGAEESLVRRGNRAMSSFDLGGGVVVFWKDKKFNEVKHWLLGAIGEAVNKKTVQI